MITSIFIEVFRILHLLFPIFFLVTVFLFLISVSFFFLSKFFDCYGFVYYQMLPRVFRHRMNRMNCKIYRRCHQYKVFHTH